MPIVILIILYIPVTETTCSISLEGSGSFSAKKEEKKLINVAYFCWYGVLCMLHVVVG